MEDNISDKLELVRQKCLHCNKCSLCQTRTNIVFSGGVPNPKLMLIGEAPGYYEDQKGVPFVGKAGQLLDKILGCVGFYRERDIYICNTLKCRPPENRDPLPEEKAACREYLDALIRYNKAMAQRNVLLKSEVEPEQELMNVWEEMMATAGTVVYQKRKAFIDEFIPVFQSYYAYISQDREEVSLAYESHAAQGDLLQLIQESRQRDRIMGYSLKGVHKDDLVMQLGEFPIKREGSQGQNKTYLIALKLAQFEFLKRTGSQTTPLVLLDDIFDKLDASRVEQIVKLVAGDNFGQIFITDTNRDHLDKILKKIDGDYKLFEVEGGMVTERKEEAHEAE